MNPETQKTLTRPVSFSGIGLHTGASVTLTFRPAPPGTGLRFVRMDLPGRPEIAVRPENTRGDTGGLRRTVIASGSAEVHTVEHVLASLAGLGIDNLILEIDGMEAPEPVDGSARAIVEALLSAGLEDSGVPRDYLPLRETVCVERDGHRLVAVPHDGLRLSYTLQYDNPAVGTQYQSFEITPDLFISQISPARTFALWEEVETLRQAGMIRGGTLENAVVVRDGRVINDEGLRFPDEFVRHKILDLLGDLTLLGRPLRAHVMAVRSGHAANVELVRRIHEARSARDPQTYLDQIHFDISEIQDIMPHRYPFLLVDRILSLVPNTRVVGLKNVSINEPYFSGHFPGHPIMPAVLILEAMAQVGGILLLHSVENPKSKLVYFMGIDAARFRKPVVPGDSVIFELELVKLRSRICIMHGKGYVRGALVAEAELMSKIMDR